MTDLSPERIESAASMIDSVFTGSPQYVDDTLCAALGRDVVVKVETANPLRSFKGRGVDFYARQVPEGVRLVTASTGNFGQAVAYVGRKRGSAVEVYCPSNVNPIKQRRMETFGARVVKAGEDGSAAKREGKAYVESLAGKDDAIFVEDGREPAIAEGAGSIGVELLGEHELDAIVVQIGDGALISGIGTWVKAKSPRTKVIGVATVGAPSLYESWRAGRPLTVDGGGTFADGMAIQVPVPESVARIPSTVDDMVLVDDGQLLHAMRTIAETLGIVVEPAGAAGVAALQQHKGIPGRRVAVILTGSNIRSDLIPSLFDGAQ